MQKTDKERVVEELRRAARLDRVAHRRRLSRADEHAARGAAGEAAPAAAPGFAIVKNTLTRRAAEAAGAESLLALLEGPTAIAFVEAEGDPVAVAKALADTAKETKVLVAARRHPLGQADLGRRRRGAREASAGRRAQEPARRRDRRAGHAASRAARSTAARPRGLDRRPRSSSSAATPARSRQRRPPSPRRRTLRVRPRRTVTSRWPRRPTTRRPSSTGGSDSEAPVDAPAAEAEDTDVVGEAEEDRRRADGTRRATTPRARPKRPKRPKRRRRSRRMATDTAKVLETLGKMTVLELVELKNAIEEEWGVTAAAPVAVAAAAPAGGAARALRPRRRTPSTSCSPAPATRRSR